MAINFPNNPNPNDTWSEVGKTWLWDGTTWKLNSTPATGIGYTDLSVVKPNPTAAGSGDVTYNSSNGQFTYTPPVVGSTSFIGLSDTPGSLTANKWLKVNAGASSLEYVDNTFTGLTGTPSTYSAGKWLKVNAGGTALEWTDAPSGVASFTGLNDTPNSFTANKWLKVNAGGTALEWTDAISKVGTITVTDESTDTECYPLFSKDPTGDIAPKTGTNIKFNSASGQLEAGSFKKTGGTSSEFLKADGSVDTSTYLTSHVQSDWNQATNTADDYIKNKPIIPAAQIQSDWNQTTNTSLDYIKNKPNLVSTLNDLTNVDAVTNLSDGKILKYDSSANSGTGGWLVGDDATGSGGSGTASGPKCPVIDSAASSSGWVYTQNNTRCDYAGIVNDHRDIKCVKLDNDTVYEFRIHANASGGHWGWYISDDNSIGTEGVTAISGGNIHAALTANHPTDNWIGMGDASNSIVMLNGFDWTGHNTTEKVSQLNWGNEVHVVIDMPQRKVWMKEIGAYGQQEQTWWTYTSNQTLGSPVRPDSNPTFFLREDGDMGSLSGDYYFNMAVYVGNQGWIEITPIPRTESVFRPLGGSASSGGETNQNAFSNVAVSGQTTIAADGKTDTLTFKSSGGMTITTDPSTDEVTFSSSDNNTQLSTEQVQDIVGAMVDGGSETRIGVTYNDTTGKLNFVVDDMTGGSVQDKIEEGNTKAEVVDTGTGYFTVETDGTERLRVTQTELRLKRKNSTLEGGQICFDNYDGNRAYAIDAYGNSAASTIFRIIDELTLTNSVGTQRFAINRSGAIGIGNVGAEDYGTSGEVLVSQGSGTPPKWDTVSGGGGTPGGSSGQFQFNNSNSFAGSELLLATSGTSNSGSTSASLTLNGGGASGWGQGNITWEPSVGCLALTRDSFLIFGSPDNSTISMKASIGYASSVGKFIINNPDTGGISIESRGDVIFKKQDSPNTVHMVIDETNGVEIKNSLDLSTATIKDKDGDVGTPGQILSSTSTGLDWVNASTGGSDTNTTYSISCADGDNADEEKIRLTAGGSGSGDDDIILEAGTGLTIARDGDKITFTNSVSNSDTKYDLTGVATSNGVKIRLAGLTASGNTNDDIEFTPAGGISYQVTGNTVEISSINSLSGLSDVDYQSASPANNKILKFDTSVNGGKWVLADDVSGSGGDGNTTYEFKSVDHGSSTGNGTGNDFIFRSDPSTGSNQDVRLVAGNNITFSASHTSKILTLSSTNDNTTYGISAADGDNTDEEKIVLTGTNPTTSDNIVLEAGDGLTIARNNDKITFTNSETDTKYDLTGVATSNGFKIRLAGDTASGNTNDDIELTPSGGISYTVTGNTCQISSINSISGLSDVDFQGNSPANNQILKFNTSVDGGKWCLASDDSGGGADGNNYASSFSWNSGNGVLTLNRGGTSSLSSITVDLDGRYATGTIPTNNNQLTNGANYITSSGTVTNSEKVRIRTDTDNTMHNLVFVDSYSDNLFQTLKIDNATNSLCYNPWVNRLIGQDFQSFRMTSWSNDYGNDGQFLMSNGALQWEWSDKIEQTSLGEIRLNGPTGVTTTLEGAHLQFEDMNGSTSYAIDTYRNTSSGSSFDTMKVMRFLDQSVGKERFSIGSSGEWGIGHVGGRSFGSSGQVMISRGQGQSPIWGNASQISANVVGPDIDNIYNQLNAIGNDSSIITVAQIKAALAALTRS